MPARPKTALIGAATGVALLFVIWFAAFHIGVLKHVDQSVFGGFLGLGAHSSVHAIATFIADLCNPSPYVYFAAVPLLIGLARGRPRVAVAAGAMMLGANATTQLFKPLLAEPRPTALLHTQLSAASWPSGHATAAMSLALAFVLVSPSRLRPYVAALGAGFAAAVSYSFLSLGWHYPSDVLGGFLVATTWSLLILAALLWVNGQRERTTPRPLRVREALTPPAAALGGALALAGAVVAARPHEVLSYARAHQAFTVGATGIGLLALALATAVVVVRTGTYRAPTMAPRRRSRRG